MKQAVILGSPDTKRTIYFKQAAEQEGLPVVFVDWKNWRAWQQNNSAEQMFIKIDPPYWTSCSLEALNQLADDYIEQLAALELWANEQMQEGIGKRTIAFLNTPSAIITLLDKQICKQKLVQAKIPVTETVGGEALLCGEQQNADWLLDIMRRQHIAQVFIKPLKGSGAAGVSAFRWQQAKGQMALYTCALLQNGTEFINTKRLRHFSDPSEVIPLLNQILGLGCIVERWYAKAQYQGFSYDIRAVVQEGTVDFMLGRLSKGPITNLHLNNHALDIAELALPERVIEELRTLCQKSAACFPHLRSVGIDILLEKDSFKPRIIEMNAQGDLIYKDIYHENYIYRHQARIIKDWLY